MTAKEAAQLAKMSNSKKLILSHFWPPRDKILYLNDAKQVFSGIIIAEDNLIIEFD